jgi:uncharacterized membrane protein
MLKHRILFAVLYLVVDIVYVAIASPIYMQVVKAIQQKETPFNVYRGIAALAAYLCMALGFVILVAPAIERLLASGMCASRAGIAIGFTFGLVLYGVFNFTNYAMFADYTPWILLQDMLWGVTWATTASVLYAMYVQKKL